jgi:CRISPR-associated protein Cas2
MFINGYQSMWLFVLFDLPSVTDEEKSWYRYFRKKIMKDGFTMMQYSVYIRHCASQENADVHEKRVVDALPPEGNIRVLRLTDKQFERMKNYYGKKAKKTETPPAQLEFF